MTTNNVKSQTNVQKNEERKVAKANEINITGTLKVFCSVAETPYLKIVAESDDAIATLETKEINGVLDIFFDGSFNCYEKVKSLSTDSITVIGNNNTVAGRNIVVEGDGNVVSDLDIYNGGVVSSGNISVYIGMPDFNKLTLNGSGSVDVSGIDQPCIELLLQGSGDIKAQGSVTRLISNVSGSGSVDCQNLVCANSELSVIGSGSIIAKPLFAISAIVSGSGSIDINSNPHHREEKIKGSGSIEYNDK